MILLIPWIVYGFKNPTLRFMKLNQDRKSVSVLMVTEIVFFVVLYINLGEATEGLGGSGSFVWNYYLIYAKNIFPVFFVAEYMNPIAGDRISSSFPQLYLLAAFAVDYVILFVISPNFGKLIRGMVGR